jgi:predicted nucleic acid-binding protein
MPKALVVDANILVRAVLGRRVREVIETHAEDVLLFVPESGYVEAEEHLAALVVKHGGDPEKALVLLRCLAHLMELIGSEVYGEFEVEARERLARRDPEDTDFFGCGVATWTSDRVRMFLRE